MLVGFQYRPIFKNKFFNSGNTDLVQNNVNFVIAPSLGYSWGMVVRKQVASKISFEGGINYLKRKYIFEVDDLDSSFATSAELNAIEEIAVHVTGNETGGEFIRMLENIATANLNLKEIEAVSISGKTGWILSLDKEHVNTLLTQLNVS